MDPLDPAKNVEGSGFSRRRISSILKAPRKSTINCDPEQQENEVESVRPVEKRNSRRVSFAPATDVLLFAKDAKNPSPARSPLQELMSATASATQNRVLGSSTENGNQQILGIENLLTAPLHTSQQKDVANFDSGNDFGEKTVMFSTEDAVMDMTQSHTINIASDAEILGDISMQNYDMLPGDNRKVTVDDRSTDVSLSHIVNMKCGSVPLPTSRGTDVSVEKRNISSKLPLDPAFENFLASFSKPSGSGSNTVNTRVMPFAEPSSEETSNSMSQNRTQIADVDKENQVPKSNNTSRKATESFQRNAFCPEEDVDMDVTEDQTGRILGVGDDDLFQCLFPTKAMYAHADKGTSQMTEVKQQHGSKILGPADPKEKKSLINPLLRTPQQRLIGISDPKDECKEKPIIFTKDDEYLDMTRSQIVNTVSSSLAPVQRSAKSADSGFNDFFASLSRPSDPSRNPDIHRSKPVASPPSKTTNDENNCLFQHEKPRPHASKENWLSNTSRSGGGSFGGGIIDDTSMDLTETQTGRITGLTGSDDNFQFLISSQDVCPLSESRKKADVNSRQQSSELTLSNHKGMKTSVKSQVRRQQENPESEEKTVRFTADDACMDVTKSHTVNISTGLKHQFYQNVDVAPSCGEKTVRFTVDDAPMDMTQCLTVNIDSNLVSDLVPSARKGLPQNGSTAHPSDPRFSNPSDYNVGSAQPSDELAICPEDDVSMDMTEVQMGCITEIQGADHPLQCPLPTGERPLQSVNLKKTEMTPHQQSNETIGTSKCKAMETSFQISSQAKMQSHQVTFQAKDDHREKTVRFTFDDNCMDVTRSHTSNIVSRLLKQPYQIVDKPANEEKTIRFSADDASMDVTRSHTVNIASDLKMVAHQNVEIPPINREKTIRFSADDASMDVTRSHTVNIASDLKMVAHQNVEIPPINREKTMRFSADDASMDVTRSHTVNIASDLKMVAHQNVEIPPINREKTMRFSADDASMDVTRSHTVNIASDLKMVAHQNVEIPPINREKTMRFSADDASMDVTRSHTVNIASDLKMVAHQNVEIPPINREKTMRFSADDASMDVTRSHTVNIASDLKMVAHQNVEIPPTNREKTMRFSADDASMDVTRSHTVNIASDLKMVAHQNVEIPPTNREKTMRFSADGASMDVTRSHTVNIASDLKMVAHQNVEIPPTNREKTMRFSADDASMDVTRSHTVNIASDLKMVAHQNVEIPPTNREKTMRFSADDASMDVTRSHTVNITSDLNGLSQENLIFVTANKKKTSRVDAMDVTRNPTLNVSTGLDLLPHQKLFPLSTNGGNNNWDNANVKRSQIEDIATEFEPKSYQNMDFVPTCEERTMTLTANDTGVTQSQTVNIASDSASAFVLPPQNFPENLNFPIGIKKSDNETCVPHSNRPSSARGLNQEYEKSMCETRSEAADNLLPQETDSNDVMVQRKTQKPDMNTEKETPGLVIPVMEKPEDKTIYCLESSVNMDMTEAQTGCVLEQTSTDFTPTSVSTAQGPRSEALGSSSSDAGIKNPPDCLDSNEMETVAERKPTPAAYLSQKMENSPSAVNQDGDVSRSRKSRRMSLADLQSKVRRLSHIINTASDAVAVDSCTAPLPQLNQDINKNSNDKTMSVPEVEPELDMMNTQHKTQAVDCNQSELHPALSATTPFSLKTKKLISSLSVGGFKPKLPQRANPEGSKKVASAGEPTRTVTVSVTSRLDNSCNDVSDIYDEELGSCEDMSETLETRSPDKKESPSHDFNVFEPFEEIAFKEESVRTVSGQKRSLPEDEDSMEDEKRLKASAKFIELNHQSDAIECDSNIATTRVTTQTINLSSSSHTASRCEATFESTLKNSLFESQLEDYPSDAQKKLEDGTITVLEFFKLFNIDFVIHNPRQSIVPGRHLPATDTTSLDLLKDRHISLPKELVYEKDIQTLTEKVERLKVRMRDLDKPLKTVNRQLWEEMRYSSEKEIKSFHAKLKEKNNFFRKTAKILSHEMKVDLYSNLVKANQEEQQKLRGTIEKADGMIKSLDECICELEAELAAIEEEGTEEKPSLKSLQEETKKVTEALADKDRQISELEMQKTQNSSKLNRLKAETRNLESHINMLNMLNEWKFKEKTDTSTVYTFLHETMYLELVYENSNDSGCEQKITGINFKLALDDEKAHFHVRLVHKLVSQYIEGESAWVDKYPTRGHVPKLLRDVSLVVSRCRLLGEELRLLKTWGGLRLDILDISCVDTRLHIVFSSLKTLSKFEVVFGISLINQQYVLNPQSIKNVIGSTMIQQIEEIVASFTPSKKLLTKIVKKIHETLLS